MADFAHTLSGLDRATLDKIRRKRVADIQEAMRDWRTRYTVVNGELVRTPEAQAEADAWLAEREAEIAREEELARQARNQPIGDADLYFIGSAHGPIKIGLSAKPERRLNQLQTSNPYKLQILALVPGGAVEEITYHERFADHRLHGEWFAPHPDILAEIERLKETANA